MSLIFVLACAPFGPTSYPSDDSRSGESSDSLVTSMDSSADADVDADTDADADADTDADTDADADTDTDAGHTGTGDPVVSVSLLAEGDLVISEVMKDVTTVDDDVGEWFEVTNPTAWTLDLDGLVVSDRGGESFTVVGTLLVGSGDAVVLAASADPAVNGGVSAAFGWGAAMSLGNGDDELVLEAGGTELDRVEWDNGTDWPDLTGASMQLGTPFYGVDNNDGGAWCASTRAMPNGESGTPGTPNDPC